MSRKKSARVDRVGEAASAYAALPGTMEKPVRKNHYLFQSKIDQAKEILGAATETEALDGALNMLIYGESLARGTERMAGQEYNDVLDIGSEIPPDHPGA